MIAKRAGYIVLVLTLLGGGCEQLAELFGQEKSPSQKATEAMNLAAGLLAQHDEAGAEAAYRKAMTFTPQDSAPVLAIAALYEQRGEDTRAMLELQQAAEILVADSAPRERVGDIFLRQDRFALAANAYRKALEIAPMSDALGRKLALASLASGKLEEARREITRMKGSDPLHPETRALEGLLLGAEGHTNEGRVLLEEAARASTEMEPSRLLGIFYLRTGEPSAAVQAFKGARDRGGNDPWTLRLLAEALIASGAGSEAADILRPAVKARPRDPIVLAAFARALVSRGQYEEALEAAGRAVQQNSSLGAAHLGRGEALEGLGRVEQARRAYRRASTAAPHLVEPYRRLGALERSQGRVIQAVEAFERVLAHAPGDRQAQIDLLEAYLLAPSEARKGIALVERLLLDRPGDPRLEEIQRKLKKEVRRRPSSGRRTPVIIR